VFDVAEWQKAAKQGRLLAKGLPRAGGRHRPDRLLRLGREEWKARGEQVILCRHETSPRTSAAWMPRWASSRLRRDDLPRGAGGPADGKGGGGRLRRPHLRLPARTMTVAVAGGTRVFREGDWIPSDGSSGELVEGKIHHASEVIQVLIEKTLEPEQARSTGSTPSCSLGRQGAPTQGARQRRPAGPGAGGGGFRAQGIGLCRTEHMFFGEGKIGPMRERSSPTTGRPPQGAGQAPPAAARRLRRHLPRHGLRP